jgi:oxygen-dependent protoporphyrinogen oxidase
VAFFTGSYDTLLRLARDIGMADEIIDVSPQVGVMRDGKVYYLRSAGLGALIDFARTKLISPWSKLLLGRFVLDVLKERKNLVYDDAQARAKVDTESMGEYGRRRLNVELTEKLLAPLMGCLYLVDGTTVSAFDLHFGALRLLGSGLKGFRHGVDFLAREISKRIDVQTDAEVTLIEPIDNGVRVTWKKGSETYEEKVAGIVSTVPAPVVPRIYPSLDPKIKTLLEKVGQWEYIVVRVALRERPDNDAGVVSVPVGELGGIAMIFFEHNVSPGVAPPGKAVVGAFLYEPWAREHTDATDQEMIDSVLASLEKVIPGISHLVEFAQVNRWPMGSPVLQHGAHKAIAELDALLDPRSRVQFGGDYLCTASTNGAALSGELAAARLAATIESALDRPQIA